MEKIKNYSGLIIGELFIAFMMLIGCHMLRQYPSYRKGVFISFLFVMLGYGLFYFMFYIKSLSLYKAYFVSGTCFGLAFMFLMPVYSVPDERIHIWKAYELSNNIMRIESSVDSIVMREDDYNFPLKTEYVTSEDYEEYYEKLFSSPDSGKLIKTDFISIKGYEYLYFMPAIGITICRLFGAATGMVFMFGRFMNLLMFTFLMSLAIKNTSVGKICFLLCGFLPITLQQAASFSYDAMIVGTSMVAIAYTIRIMYEKNDLKLKNIDWVIYIASCCLLFMTKGRAYSLIALLPLVPLILYFRQGLKFRKKLIIGLCIIVAFGITLSFYESLMMDGAVWLSTGILGAENKDVYTIPILLHMPKRIMELFVYTINRNFVFYIVSITGEQLGYFNVQLPAFITYGWIIITILAVMKSGSMEACFNRLEKTALAMVVFFTICFIFGGFLLITPTDSLTIQGVQGRYFLPILPLFLILLQNGKYTVIEASQKKVIFIMLIWIVFTIIELLNRLLLL